MFFMRMQTLPFLVLFTYMRFVLFVREKSFCKKKKVENCPNDLNYITTKFLLPVKILPAIFTGFKQLKKLTLGETLWLMGHHATPEVTLFFYYHHVTYRTPCYASGHLVIFTMSATDLREHFLPSGVFYLLLLPASFKASLGPVV